MLFILPVSNGSLNSTPVTVIHGAPGQDEANCDVGIQSQEEIVLAGRSEYSQRTVRISVDCLPNIVLANNSVLDGTGVDVIVLVACAPFHHIPTICGSKSLPTQSDSDVLQLYVSGRQQLSFAFLQISSVAYESWARVVGCF